MLDSNNKIQNSVITLDLNFLGLKGAIASYLIPHAQGAALVECGPGSTVPALQAALQENGYRPEDVTDVFITHIHLDHAGAAGWMAERGACIHVHPVGAPHMIQPEKLLSSAARIYGDQMESLWGEFLPVPESKISITEDEQVVEFGGRCLQAFNTPGHASHHHVYLFEDICFSGDIGGIRLQGSRHLRVPMPPPEFNLELWKDSLEKLHHLDFKQIAPTHFGLFSDPADHLERIDRQLEEIGAWMEALLPADPPREEINERFQELTRLRSLEEGVEPGLIEIYEAANPSWMSAQGMQRYWQKYRS